MTTSTDPVSPEHEALINQSLSPGDRAVATPDDGPADLYAENELRRRQERTERMIRLAEEQMA